MKATLLPLALALALALATLAPGLVAEQRHADEPAPSARSESEISSSAVARRATDPADRETEGVSAPTLAATAFTSVTAAGEPPHAARVVDAGPGDYLPKLRSLRPGDTLQLAPGIYTGIPGTPGLPVYDLNGTPGAPITITGPASGSRAVFLGTARHNTVRLANASYVVIRNLEIDGRDLGGDGVNAQRTSHHITLDNLLIHGVGDAQSTVAIATHRAPTWNWTIRRCTIVGAGTGMYLGHSDGRHPFVAGIIEHNLIRDTLGYNIQVKHQSPWPADVALPDGTTRTIIRHNVFIKGANASTGAFARPSLLVGDVPIRGPGRDNGYEIYGNFFFQNPTEALFQGEGNVAFYANVLVNDGGPGITIQRHNGHVRDVRVFGNTIVASGHGIAVVPGESNDVQEVVGNAVFASVPILAPDQRDNAVGTYSDAANELVNPSARSGALDLAPKPGHLRGTLLDVHALASFTEAGLDFDRRPRDWRVRGAYGGASGPGRWPLQASIKP
jgi:hypothetical protein